MKLALVTGGHRRLGGTIAALLAESGWTLALHGAHDAEPDEHLTKAIADSGAVTHGFVADLSDTDAVARLIPAVVDHFGTTPTLLVNNAALFGEDEASNAGSTSLARYHDVNYAAPVALALALHQRKGAGAVVNIVDQRIRNPVADQFSYTLSKSSLAAATRPLAVALAPHIRVNAVAPGLTLPTADYAPGQLERLAQAMPLGRLSSPIDIARTVLFLAESPAITGQTLFVDGGASLKSFDRDFVHL